MRFYFLALILTSSNMSYAQQGLDCFGRAEYELVRDSLSVALRNNSYDWFYEKRVASKFVKERHLDKVRAEVKGFVGQLKKHPNRKKLALQAVRNSYYIETKNGKPVVHRIFPEGVCIDQIVFVNKELEDYQRIPARDINDEGPKFFKFSFMKNDGVVYTDSWNSNWWYMYD